MIRGIPCFDMDCSAPSWMPSSSFLASIAFAASSSAFWFSFVAASTSGVASASGPPPGPPISPSLSISLRTYSRLDASVRRTSVSTSSLSASRHFFICGDVAISAGVSLTCRAHNSGFAAAMSRRRSPNESQTSHAPMAVGLKTPWESSWRRISASFCSSVAVLRSIRRSASRISSSVGGSFPSPTRATTGALAAIRRATCWLPPPSRAMPARRCSGGSPASWRRTAGGAPAAWGGPAGSGGAVRGGAASAGSSLSTSWRRVPTVPARLAAGNERVTSIGTQTRPHPRGFPRPGVVRVRLEHGGRVHQVRVERRGGELAVARLERLEHRAVALGEVAEVRAGPRDRHVGAQVGLEERPLPLERRVARAAHDRAVEGGIRLRLLVCVPGRGRRLHRVEERAQLPQLAVGHAFGGEPGGERLERRADGERLEQLGDGDRADGAAAVGLVDHAADVLEVAERLADRRLGDAQLLRDPRLDEPGARRVGAGEDALQHHVLDPLAQAAAEQRGVGLLERAGKHRKSIVAKPPAARKPRRLGRAGPPREAGRPGSAAVTAGGGGHPQKRPRATKGRESRATT